MCVCSIFHPKSNSMQLKTIVEKFYPGILSYCIHLPGSGIRIAMWNEKVRIVKSWVISKSWKMQRNCRSSDIHVQTEGFKGQEWYCIRKQKAFQSPKGGRKVNSWKASKFKKSKSETPSELLDWLKLLGANLLGEWQASNQPSSLHVAHPWSHPLLHLLYLCKPCSSKISNLQIQKRPKSLPRTRSRGKQE